MKRQKNRFLRGLILTLAVFAVLICVSWMLISGMSEKSSRAQTELVRSAVHSAVTTCYAVEGAYPSDLEYLKTHYGLVYDEDAYAVQYDAFASNLMPDISVLEKGEMP